MTTTNETPICPKCNSSRNMIKTDDEEWVCHGTHILEPQDLEERKVNRIWKILILEDNPDRIKSFMENIGFGYDDNAIHITVVNTAVDAHTLISRGGYDILFLDHDLGGKVYCESNEKSGYQITLHYEEGIYEIPPRLIIIHSQNHVAVPRMKAAMENAIKRHYTDSMCFITPFCWEYDDLGRQLIQLFEKLDSQ